MPESQPDRRYRFGAFEADTASGELRKKGIRIKLNAQPFQVLVMLLERPGQVLSREEISRGLWPDGTFVDYDHGVNSAVNRIREALGDSASNPRFVETLARRGYRFAAPVERIGDEPPERVSGQAVATDAEAPVQLASVGREPAPDGLLDRVLASPADLPEVSHPVVQTLFVLLQLMYVGYYVGALANLAELEELLAPLAHRGLVLGILVGTAALLIPVRAYVVSATLLHAPGAREKLLRLWLWLLLPADVLWALSPFLLLHHINIGVALACMAMLVYAPFAERSLILMGAGGSTRK